MDEGGVLKMMLAFPRGSGLAGDGMSGCAATGAHETHGAKFQIVLRCKLEAEKRGQEEK